MLKHRVRLSGQTKLLITDQVFRKICDIFFDLFLSTYMYKVSEENGVLYLAIYNSISWLTTCILVFGVSRVINRYNKIWIYRLGVTIKLSIILLVALLGPNISSLFWLVGILSGFMIATNGYIVNYFEAEIIPKTEIIRYVGLGNAYSSLTNSIVPIILGSSIFLNSFEFTAIILCAIVGIELVVCFGIKGKKSKLHHHKLSYRNFIKLAIHDPKYRSLCLQQVLSGINRNGVMGLLVSVLVFQAVGNELSLGSWTSIFSISGIIAMLLFARFYKNQRRTITQLTAGLLAILGCLPLFFEVNFINVVIFNFIFFTLIRLMEKIVHIDLINYSKTEPYQSRYLIEYFSIREIFLTIGRVIGYGSLGLVALFGLQLDGLRAIFILIAFSIILMAIVSARFSYLKSTKNWRKRLDEVRTKLMWYNATS